MLNFRKLKKDYSPTVLKEGREIFIQDKVLSVKILSLKSDSVRLACQVIGNFDHTYTCELEIDRYESITTDSDCDCTYSYDCQHLAAVLFYLEEHLNGLLVSYSKETDLDAETKGDEKEKKTIQETIKQAETKEVIKKELKQQKELLEEYVGSSEILGQSPFFLPEEEITQDEAELAVILMNQSQKPFDHQNPPEVQLALRLPFRSKPLHIMNVKEFLDAMRYREALYIGTRRFFFALDSFDESSAAILKLLMDFARFPEGKNERNQRVVQVSAEAFGTILSEAYDYRIAKHPKASREYEADLEPLPCIYTETLEAPICFSRKPVDLIFGLEYLEAPAPKLLINPTLVLEGDKPITLEQAHLFECAKPGLIHDHIYYRFQSNIRRKHLRNLPSIRGVTIPEPLFGTFVENSLPELLKYSHVSNREVIDKFVTLPYVKHLGAECDIQYLNGELEVSLHFIYDDIKLPAAASQLIVEHIEPFVTKEGVLARNLTEEQKIIDDLLQDFIYDPLQGVFVVKNDKKIVEFMTEVVPRNQHRVKFNCPENLLEQFIYDDTSFKLNMKETDRIDCYQVDLKVTGHLNGLTLDQLWECIASRRSFIELAQKKGGKKKGVSGLARKILVLDLEKLEPIVQIFDEIGINRLDDHVEERPLWSLASIEPIQFEGLPISFFMSKKLKEIQQQMLGNGSFETSPLPEEINAKLRHYQTEGVSWLERLRTMHLSGILADDMGLGKTLQAIIAVTQHKAYFSDSVSLVVCPTSLVYNWIEEFTKFNPKLRTLAIDGTPQHRRKLLAGIQDYDVVVTSYSLLQKDIEAYEVIPFGYVILDEAQHIKNRGTRNAKSVKQIQAAHRLILTGTPIENSLDELWSLFDFLMPGLLSSYDRFVEKYIRNPTQPTQERMELLRRKLSPFILRRMKQDVLEELPPVSEIVYHCHLTEAQRNLYQSYAASAREELAELVKKEGFDRVQIHVLATLTRLKQICCHPAIFAKEKAEIGDSAKYDMLMDLLHDLIEGQHKTVIFSQYTRMLNIMRDDLKQQGIPYTYLDGTTKNRLSIVKQFNEDAAVPVFLVSLKAGGSGLNLVGADTVIHYDMWWNPAVENQATDRVHRIGQKRSVSSYKLITKGTIEEKIIEMQNRKRGLVKKIVSCDEEAISKLTWEEVLELLQT